MRILMPVLGLSCSGAVLPLVFAGPSLLELLNTGQQQSPNYSLCCNGHESRHKDYSLSNRSPLSVLGG